ncbi:MAG: YceI family protein [Gammaproteobacteria bacterium]|nr:YceI family protein [Gammaproteobacteria bacterium]MDH5172172.1 YceI family protein [Gammaproteobacteria bacterium]
MSFLRWFLLALLAGCAAPGDRGVESAPSPVEADSYFEAARRGAPVYEVVPEQSLLLIHVGRDGAARRLGHDHAVASEQLSGFVALGTQPGEWRADIAFPVRNLTVDKPEYRERLGLDTQPTEADIAGTYGNMLRVLEPDLYPWVSVRLRLAAIGDGGPELAASVTLHGSTAEYLVPVTLETGPSTLTARGRVVIRHSDFGLEPFSAMGGLLRVADELPLEFYIVARRLPG